VNESDVEIPGVDDSDEDQMKMEKLQEWMKLKKRTKVSKRKTKRK
jgi:hypothetical protein